MGSDRDPQRPKYFFVTGGAAVSRESELNAFDEALMQAGIAQCNLVPVSSILPADAVEVDYVYITPGTITFVIMAVEVAGPGAPISAGVVWGFGTTEDGVRYGLVAEAHGRKSREELRAELERKIRRMAEARRMELESLKYRIESLEQIPEGAYGAVVAAVVFVPSGEEHKVAAGGQGVRP